MLVVHGVWSDGQLGLWAEDTSANPTSPATLGKHPFSCGPEALEPFGGTAGELDVELPGTPDGPVPSPESGLEGASGEPEIIAWRVAARFLAPREALPFLESLKRHDWCPGGSLRYLSVVAEHARDLVRRGRMLPQMVMEDGEYAARWRPVLTGRDADAVRKLTAARPPVVGGDALEALVDVAARDAMPDRLIAAHRPGVRSDLAHRWLIALTGDDPMLPEADILEALELSRALKRWMAGTKDLDGSIRATFELVEPDVNDDEWEVEFGLRTPDGPVTAAEAWDGPHAETLRAEIRRAVRLFPDLYTAFREAEPTRLEVSNYWAHAFLRQGAPLLRAAGYGVRLPEWAGRQGLGLKLTTRGASTDLGSSLNFRVDLIVGDQVVSGSELESLEGPLVRIHGRWVELDRRQLEAAHKAVRQGEMTTAEVIRYVVDGSDDLPLVEIDSDGILGDLLSGDTDRRLAPLATPADFHGELRPYQERGLSWLSFLSQLGLGGILADDMGLGKTAQALALMLQERSELPTLLMCPMSVVGNWHKEAARFTPSLRVYIHHGASRKKGPALREAVGAADLVVTTYGTALRDQGGLRAFRWERVICDEAQAIKNPSSQQAQAVRSIGARTRLALTGTPVENHLGELWSIMEFCNPGLLGSARRFRDRFAEPLGEDSMRSLRQATGPFILRRLKTDKSIISDLPEKLEMKVWCTLTPEQASMYRAVVGDMMSAIEGTSGMERRGNVLTTMTRLKQICNHPAHFLKDGSPLSERSGKLARLEEIAEEILEEGDKALVFTQYAEFGALLQPYLAAHLDRPVLWLHGGVPQRRRDALVTRFQESSEPMLFLLSLRAGGTGLNLTAASHVIHVDRWWNPAVENQATDRAFRIGQTRNVQVRKFICVDTLEERIDAMIERKKFLAETVVGTGEEWISELSTDQLRELFRLGPGAES